MADIDTISTMPAPARPPGAGRTEVVAKQGIPMAEARRFSGSSLPSRGPRASFHLDDQASPQEQQVASKVHQLFAIARQHRRPLVSNWRRWDMVMANRTWMQGRPSYLPRPEVPEIRPILSTLVAYVTDPRPSIELAPSMLPNSDTYDWWMERCWDLQTTAESILHNQRSEGELTKMASDAYRYGTGILKTTWDQALDGGLGNARMDRVNPYCFYPDPNATNEVDGSYYIEVKNLSLQELDRRFPGAATRLNPTTIDHDAPNDPLHPSPQSPRANPGAISGTGYDGQTAPTTSANWGLPGQSSRSSIPTGEEVYGNDVTLIECWVRTHEHINPLLDVPRMPTSTMETWRCICVVGNRVLLDCEAKQLYGHTDHPYSRYVTEDEGNFWGQSMVELLAPSQREINKGLAAISHNLDLHGNPILKESSRANIDRSTLTNKAGQRLRYAEGGEVDWLKPPPIHPLHMDMVHFYIEEMERISGLNAISRGANPGGRNSADVVNQMQESGFVRVRLALRNMEYTLRNAYVKLADLIIANYASPRVIAIVGDSGQKTTMALGLQHFQMPTENGRVPLRYSMLVNAGSGLPVSRSAFIEQMNFLFSVNAIDRQALLTAHRVPNWQLIDQRMTALEQAGLMAAQEQSARSGSRA